MKALILSILLSINCFAYAQTTYRVNSNGGLNLRENTNRDSKIINSLPDGTKVTVIDKSNDKWWKVKVDGKTGYVSSEYLKVDNNKPTQQNSRQQASNQSKNSNNTSASSNRNTSSSASSNASVWAAGLRLGDPMGLSVKKYLNNNRAFEINIGRTTYWGLDYRNRFYNNNKFKLYDYYGYNRRGAMSIQFHYLYHKNIANADGLQWYLGFGPQLRLKTFSYQYRYRAYNQNGSEYWAYANENVTDFDLGIDGVIGLEYRINNSPISIFGEGNLFFEIVDRPSLIGQGGLGIRIHF